ncbi:MAG: hypothetical protein EAX90_10040, partial [Candidatus Heimdallarchaeota archaeon]|nr:hypothetical protein [Candidatus Heimdallarchaeota archaeon]
TVFALDDTGLYGRESVFVIKDTTGPTITITSPLDGAAVKVTNLEISWSASDEFSAIDRYDIYINSGFYQTVYSKSHIITITNDISYTIEIVAFDQLGNYNSDSITITRDTVAPTLTLDPIALPTLSDGTYYTENPSLFLSWNATDNASGTGISETKITRNGITIGTYLPTEISDTIDLGTDGLKDIVISTFDEAGNFAEVYFSIILDRTEPYIVIQTPENNSLTGLDYVIVSWSSDDAGVGIKEYEIIVDSIIIDTVANPTLSFYQVSLPDYRSYWITIRAIDYLDFSFEQSINITKSSSAPTINILNPANLYLYTNTTSLTISWDISNIDVNHFEILINGTSFDNYSSSTFSAIITFDVPLPGEYPLYNVTIYAIANDLKIYYDLRWIIIDQTPPSLNIIEPIFNDLIITTNLNVEWSSTDEGSSIKSFTLLLAGNSHFLGSTIISHVLDVTGLEGQYDLTIMAYDVAGNKIIQIIPITISLVAPGFITTLDSVIITNNPEIQFTLTINEPRLGVKSILIMLDETVEIFYENYEPTYITTEFSLLINITESNYVDGIDEHNLSISILDKIDRESNEQYSIIIDLEKPTFWQAPIIDTFLLVDEINEFILNNETSLNIHNVTVYILDGYGIENVYLTVTNENYTNILPMMRISGSHASQLFQYYVELNFNDMGAGEFSLIFNFEDIAGNSNIETYQIKLIASSQEPIPSPTPSTQNDPNNDFLYIIIAISVVVIASFIIVISLRRPISNLRWQNELVVFAYILKSGLTTIFIPYSYEIVTDEQLFGGAMSGIRGILEEIIGNKSKDEVESVEFGNKHLLIYSGKYGDNVLLVNKIKPIHSKLLKQFAEEFEEKYSNVLIDDTHVSMRDYVGASDIVEKYFGPVEDAESLSFKLSKIQRDKTKLEFDSSYKKETMVNSFYQEISSKYDSFDELSPETKVLIGDAIILAEQSVTDLISSEFKDAEKKAKTALKSLQIARERKEPLQKFNDIFSSLPSIIDEVIKGANCGKNNDIECVNRAIEIASQLFLERIMSRF